MSSLDHFPDKIKIKQNYAYLTNPNRIWLLDAKTHLATHSPNTNPYTLHGFDISAAQFLPSPETHGLTLSVHDILRPFPIAHRDRYDLVHVRMLVSALKVEEYEAAVRNLVGVLSTPAPFPRPLSQIMFLSVVGWLVEVWVNASEC
jgi:hypothetical protein